MMRRVTLFVLASLCLAASANPQVPDLAEQTQINLCNMPPVQGVELAGCSLKFTGLGEITFSVKNRGTAGINTGQTVAELSQPAPARKAPSGPPIEFAVYMQDKLIVSLFQPALGAGQSKTFTTAIPSNYTKPKCGEARALKLVIDPKNQVSEVSESDNTITRNAATRPCPDLAIKSIKRDYEGLLNETYRVKVTIINQGNAPSPSTQVWATSLPGGVWPVTGWPELVPTETIGGLAPGQTTSFKVGGSVLSANKTSVRVLLDRHFNIEELDESNNLKDDRL